MRVKRARSIRFFRVLQRSKLAVAFPTRPRWAACADFTYFCHNQAFSVGGDLISSHEACSLFSTLAYFRVFLRILVTMEYFRSYAYIRERQPVFFTPLAVDAP